MRTRDVARPSGLDHDIGPAALFRVGKLLGENRGEPSRAHPRPRKDAAVLDPDRGRGDRDEIDPPPAALFKEQGNVEHNQPPRTVEPQEAAARSFDRGVNNMFEPAERGMIVKHRPAQRRAIDAVGAGRPRKGRFDMGNQRAARTLQPVNLGVGIEHRDAKRTEHAGHRRLAHADRARKSDDDHCVSRSRKSSSCSRAAGRPKKSSKATAA